MICEEKKLTNIRNLFPILQKKINGHPFIYLDSAATSQKPQVVIDAITDFYTNNYGTVHRAIYETARSASQKYQEVRCQLQKFINAPSADEIIFTKGTTESINLVAASFGKAFIKSGDEIIISAMEHHANIVPWQILCQDKGASLKVIPMNECGELILSDYQKLLSPKTKLVSIAHVANSIGTINPVLEVIKLAKEAGSYIFVDCAQSASHLSLDVQALGADFIAFSGHKMYGPTGVGVLWGKSELLNQMPPYQAGGDMISTVTFEKTTYNALPLKFEAGTPMIAEVIGLGKAISFLTDIGLQEIFQHEKELLTYATSKLSELSQVKIHGTAQEKAAIISFTVDGMHALDVGTFLDLKGIAIRTGHHCAQPVLDYFQLPAMCRVSFGVYNTFADIDAFIEALTSIIEKYTR